MRTLLLFIYYFIIIITAAVQCTHIVRFLFTFWRSSRPLKLKVNIESISEMHIICICISVRVYICYII